MLTITETVAPAMLDRATFRAALHAAQAQYDCKDTRLYQSLKSGRCPRSVILRYAESSYRSAVLFCATVAEFTIRAPDREARLFMLENLLEEEGMHLRADTGIVHRKEQGHIALALRFLRACGGDPDKLDRAQHATTAGRAMLAEGRYLEAMSHLLIGQELKFGTASQEIMEALKPYGFSNRDLAFFAVHGDADLKHGNEALDIVVTRADTAEMQQRCLAEAAEGARIWFAAHGGGVSGAARAA